jgi:hypothetical protein
MDNYIIANTEIMHVEPFESEGTHILTFKANGEAALADLMANGMETYLFCESL